MEELKKTDFEPNVDFLKSSNILITEENQYSVQEYLFSLGFQWCASKFELFDVFNSFKLYKNEKKYIFIDSNMFMINDYFDTCKIINGNTLLRKSKIKKLL